MSATIVSWPSGAPQRTGGRITKITRFRFRQGWFGRMVLQVEETVRSADEGWQFRRWRDARRADLARPTDHIPAAGLDWTS
jgi:hypothetical protein